MANRTRSMTVALGVAAFLAAIAVNAQNVSISGGQIEIFDTDGDSAVLLDQGSDYTAGGNGRTATLNLRAVDGPTTLSFHAFQAQLVLGGGTHEGILLLKDDDGVTTTIEIDGRTGAVLLGGNNEDGDVIVYDNSDIETIRMNGQNGTVTNRLAGNGLVKAWAKINSSGGVVSCYRCNVAGTSSPEFGEFRVDFSPLGSDIRARPRMAVLDSHASDLQLSGALALSDSAVPSAVLVHTFSSLSQPTDRGFTVFIY